VSTTAGNEDEKPKTIKTNEPQRVNKTPLPVTHSFQLLAAATDQLLIAMCRNPATTTPLTEAPTTQFRLKTLFGILLYVSTGILQPLLTDNLRLQNNLGRKTLLLPTLANTCGMALCGLLVSPQSWNAFFRDTFLKEGRMSRLGRFIGLTAVVDLISGMMLTFGLLQTGGGVFVVLYNSCPMWTALLTWCVLGRRLGAMQLAGVAAVCVGLVVNVLGSATAAATTGESGATTSRDSGTVVFGSLVVLAGSLLHSLMFVLSDMALCDEKNRGTDAEEFVMSGQMWSSCLGMLEALFMTFWVLAHVAAGGFYDVVADAQMPETSSVGAAVRGFALLLFVDAVHAASFFQLLQKMGALPSALLKGVQAVAVVGLSVLFYCPMGRLEEKMGDETACLTPLRALSVILVVLGVCAYGYASRGDSCNADDNVCDIEMREEGILLSSRSSSIMSDGCDTAKIDKKQ